MRYQVMNRAVMAVALTLAFGGAPALAQLSTPAEQPPAGFDGLEYVDSAGCVFARIDVGDRVEWVPRVGPDRQQLCGLEPTVAVAAAPMVEVMPEPVIEASMPAPSATPAPVRAAAPRTAVRTAAAHPVPPAPAIMAPPPQLVPVQILLPDTVASGDVRLAAPCPDPASIAAQYLENSIVPECSTARAPSTERRLRDRPSPASSKTTARWRDCASTVRRHPPATRRSGPMVG